ncbi:hypothetical protein NHQ30_006882 [Ciborinia camelliae]|nr:hypothetical protein NHQ30_006882 [Ciborinia camelliae]
MTKLSAKNEKKLLEVRREIEQHNVEIADLRAQEQILEKFNQKCLDVKTKWVEESCEILRKYKEREELVIDTSDQNTADSSPLTTPGPSPDGSPSPEFRGLVSLPKVHQPHYVREYATSGNDRAEHLQYLQSEFLAKSHLREQAMEEEARKEEEERETMASITRDKKRCKKRKTRIAKFIARKARESAWDTASLSSNAEEGEVPRTRHRRVRYCR